MYIVKRTKHDSGAIKHYRSYLMNGQLVAWTYISKKEYTSTIERNANKAMRSEIDENGEIVYFEYRI